LAALIFAHATLPPTRPPRVHRTALIRATMSGMYSRERAPHAYGIVCTSPFVAVIFG
jgi:hypothetical protein